MRTRIKICGITRAEDALVAAEAGADAVGLVFVPGARRCLSLDAARSILAVLPPFVTPVGLFVDEPADRIRAVADDLRLTHVQLHGRETPEQARSLQQLVVLKAVRADRDRLAGELQLWQRAQLPNLRGITLETAGTQQAGGSGVANDWGLIESAGQQGWFANLPPIILAGGLTPETVGDVVRRIRPAAVDVSSGVEDSPGQKSNAKIQAFVRAVRQADADHVRPRA